MAGWRALAPLFFMLGLFASTLVQAGEEPVLRFAVVPQQAAGELAEAWSPLLTRLSERSGLKLQFTTAPDIAIFYQRLGQGEYDFAYMNPYQYSVFHRQSGYEAFAREQGRKLQGIVVVRHDSPIKQVSELNGATLAFPSPTSFAASLLTQAELRHQGVVFTPRFVSSHDSVYLGVAKGLFPAGGGIPRTLEMVDPTVRASLRVLLKTQAYTPHAFAYHPRVGSARAGRVLAAMRGLAEDPEGRQLLAMIGFKGIEAGSDGDWNDVRALNIDPTHSARN